MTTTEDGYPCLTKRQLFLALVWFLISYYVWFWQIRPEYNQSVCNTYKSNYMELDYQNCLKAMTKITYVQVFFGIAAAPVFSPLYLLGKGVKYFVNTPIGE